MVPDLATPLVPVALRLGRRIAVAHLKLEGAEEHRSLKDRVAASLLDDAEARHVLSPSSIVVESTSGNLGVGLARLCRARGYPFVAVIDPKVTIEVRQALQRFAARLDLVEAADETGGFLLSRLARVRELCASSDRYYWPNQYGNPANPRVHETATAPEILRQMSGHLDAIFIAVSTGGTLAGVGRCLRSRAPGTRIIAVDVRGSVVFGGPPGPRRLTGIGSSRPSEFLTTDLYDEHLLVDDADAFAACRMLHRHGLRVGGSSGAVFAACLHHLRAHPDMDRVVCICPDHSDNYRSTIFSDDWLRANGADARDVLTGLDGLEVCSEHDWHAGLCVR